jgi:hypothetical protein
MAPPRQAETDKEVRPDRAIALAKGKRLGMLIFRDLLRASESVKKSLNDEKDDGQKASVEILRMSVIVLFQYMAIGGTLSLVLFITSMFYGGNSNRLFKILSVASILACLLGGICQIIIYYIRYYIYRFRTKN